MKGQDKFKPADRADGAAKLKDFVKGASDYGSIFEDYPRLNKDFPDMEKDLTARLKTATPKELASIHFDLALLRSLRDAVASSRYCLILGAVNGIRELYEGARMTLPLEPEP